MKITLLLFCLISLKAFGFDHSHEVLNKILKEHLVIKGSQTLFKYKALKAQPQIFEEYLESLSKVTKTQYRKFSDQEKLAFLINSYNAFTLKIIIKNYPVKSIKDIGGLFKNTWKIKFFKFLGKNTYLDKIEHEIIRKDFNEPRIHFAVNCASIGCPSLYPEAFVAQKLSEQLDQAAINFITNKEKNKIEDNKLYLSKIFEWYGADFDKTYGSYLKYIAPIITKDKKLQQKVRLNRLSIKFQDYNWDLNEVR